MILFIKKYDDFISISVNITRSERKHVITSTNYEMHYINDFASWDFWRVILIVYYH